MNRSFKTILVDVEQSGIVTISFNRDEKLNALNEEVVDELLEVLDELERGYPDTYRVVLIRGEGRAFCSGGDIEGFESFIGKNRSVLENYIGKFHWLAQRWYELPMPTIACLHGAVAGGGASFSLLCDLRYAAENTDIRFLFSKIGLIPDMGAHYTLPKIVGDTKAYELLYLGRPLLAKEALEIGFVNGVYRSEELHERVREVAEQLANGPATVYNMSKRLIQERENSTLTIDVSKEVSFQAERFASDEFQQSVAKFLHSPKK